MRKVVSLIASAVLIVGSSFASVSGAEHDYSTALKYSIQFFDANKCGPDAGKDNVFEWRGACHTTDGSEISIDLNGGYHDAGDHVKFGLPQAYAASILGWSLYEYEGVFNSTGNREKFLGTLKYFTDYLLKCHPDKNTFYYQVGDGQADHTYWGAPEIQTDKRPVPYVANASKPGSDVCGLTSAALSIMYLNYKNIDSTYAQRCLTAAKELYNMGKTNQDIYEENAFYISHSYLDDLAWAATWLYVIENDSKYLTEIDGYIKTKTLWGDDPLQNKWTMCWDDMYMAVFCKLAEVTNDPKYKGAMDFNLDYWMNSLQKTPGGLRYLSNWGVLRYASAEAFIALRYYEVTKDEKLYDFAKSQIDYALGTNPKNMSYLIGYGSKYPTHPHHRAANGYTYANGDNAKPAKYLLTGALVGGPDQMDTYLDDVNQFQYTEVAIDYNAAFVGAVAGIIKKTGNIQNPNTPKPQNTPTPDITPTPLDNFKPGDYNKDGQVDSTDLAILKRYILGIPVPYEMKLSIWDLNKDDIINSTDLALLKRHLLGIISLK